MPAPYRPTTALVADPSAFGTQIVRDILLREGISRVLEARDGAEALAVLAERRPDLLVLDWRLPVVPAREILAAARDGARSDGPGMPVIVTMAEPTRSAVAAAMEFRTDAILAKPFSPREFRRRLESCMRRSA